MSARPDGTEPAPDGAARAVEGTLPPQAPVPATLAIRGTRAAPARRSPFEYALIRVVPHVERGEAFNAGVVLHSRARRFLGARVHLDESILAALAPGCEATAIREHLDAIERIARGDPDAGPIARLSAPERFHWLVSPSSTVVQPSEVHTGLTNDPAITLEQLFMRLVVERG